MMKLPSDVEFIINTLYEAGYEAYAVGGCVRDSLLNKKPSDYDITTSASPEEVKRLFRRTIDTGIQHGTITVMLKHMGYEVTTYRIDGKYEDSRHPSSVEFTKSLEEDLKRRDFTINAMAYNHKEGLVDLFGGKEDLERKIVRCVGNPMERFEEDALRIMRAVRFAAQLGYSIEENTLKAIDKYAASLKNISAERIQVELVKLVTSDHPELLRVAYEHGITAVILPEFDRIMETEQHNPHHMYSVGEHTIVSMINVEKDKCLRLAMLFHDMGKADTKTTDEKGIDHFHGHQIMSSKISVEVMKRLKFDNDSIKLVEILTKGHDMDIDTSLKSVRHAINRYGIDVFPMILKIRKADTLAQSDYLRSEKLEKIKVLEGLYEEVIAAKSCLSLKDLKISGKELMDLGYKKGPEIGKELNKLLERVLDDPSLNDRDVLLRSAKEDLVCAE